MNARKLAGVAESRLLGALHFDRAGDGVNLHAATAVTHVGAERVLALLFNHDGNLRANLTGNGACGKMKAGAGRHGDVHGTGDGLQIPIAISTWIALDGHAACCGVGLHITIGVAYLDGSAGTVSIHAATWILYFNIPRNRMSKYISLGIQDGHASGNACGANVIAAVFGSDGSACRRQPDSPANVLAADRSGD